MKLRFSVGIKVLTLVFLLLNTCLAHIPSYRSWFVDFLEPRLVFFMKEKYQKFIPKNKKNTLLQNPCNVPIDFFAETISIGYDNKEKYLFAPKNACEAQIYREHLNQKTSSPAEWSALYAKLCAFNTIKMTLVENYLRALQHKEKLTRQELANTFITFVQQTLYVLIHEGTCKEDAQRNNFSNIYHKNRLPCLHHQKYGVHSPLEFAYYLQGDCDSKVLFAYTILKKLGYQVAVLATKNHAMLGWKGIGLGNALIHKTEKYYFWELSAPDWQVGALPIAYQTEKWELMLD